MVLPFSTLKRSRSDLIVPGLAVGCGHPVVQAEPWKSLCVFWGGGGCEVAGGKASDLKEFTIALCSGCILPRGTLLYWEALMSTRRAEIDSSPPCRVCSEFERFGISPAEGCK